MVRLFRTKKPLDFLVNATICSGSTTPSFVQLNYQINVAVISSQAVTDVFACENLCSSNTVGAEKIRVPSD